ncbi:hypothetical protein B5X24_HaOG213473 [Helicoverpa armigera]|uniref:V-type proton ATPase subunit S1/VOA1 transmembrane domain-containing protein n=1 Tax=Helicoverpa armigera TaxID=29058 RepID=A0A2W1B5E4_HELAM|nr:hypothetical protein B5X24_HaOG213473 [Helicoverpa armigera]
MAFCRVVFPLLVLSVISCYASIVPVYLWTDSIKSPVRSDPFTPFSTDEFAETLKQILVEDPLTLVFIEENLSVEDFSLKNANGETSFPYLHDNIEEAIYLPTVKDALEVLNRTSSPYNSENIVLGEEAELLLTPGKNNAGRFVFIHLKDAREGESRADLLRRHDAFMQKAVEDMAGDVPIVGVYTANYPSWTIPSSKSRVRRAVEAGNTRMYTVDGLRLVAKSIHLSSGNDSRTLGDVTAQSSVLNDTYVNATLTFDNTTLVLNFNSKAGYWFFGKLRFFMLLVLSRNETKTYTVSFEDLKVQPFFETNTTQEFGDAFNCVGFFSAPIWAGLFVVFILLAITFYGIMMMLDIRTMDRFDDPKGKTITINAE